MSSAIAPVSASLAPPLPAAASPGAGPAAPPVLPGASAIPSAATAPSIGAILTQLQSIVQQLQQLVGALQAPAGAAALTGGGGATAPAAPTASGCGCGGGGAGAGSPVQQVDQAPAKGQKLHETAGGALGAPVPDSPGATGASKAAIAKWVQGDTHGLNPKLLEKLAQVGEKVGKPVKIDSGYRSREEQQKLYDLYKAGKGNLAAKPGTSNHESGNAADVSIGGVSLRDSAEGKAAALSLGLKFPIPSESWHTELA